mgnify:CR=1 FL=1|tara:strand:+ start:831 stop:1631 length:801 start_codon:yes stop_codon:yes gene_type:complete
MNQVIPKPLIVILVMTCFFEHELVASQDFKDQPYMISGNIGVQTTANTRTDQIAFELFNEFGQLETSQRSSKRLLYDFGVARHLWKGFGIGASMTFANTSSDGTVTATVPSPFFYHFPRTVTTVAQELANTQRAYHLHGHYWWALREDLRLTIFGGPSFFNGSQTFVSGITTKENGLTFNQVDIRSIVTEKITSSVKGFNAGLDLTYFGLKNLRLFGSSDLLNQLGLGFKLQLSRATTSAIKLKGQYQPSLEYGGTQISGGVRFVF